MHQILANCVLFFSTTATRSKTDTPIVIITTNTATEIMSRVNTNLGTFPLPVRVIRQI